jgi:hypothetical protein
MIAASGLEIRAAQRGNRSPRLKAAKRHGWIVAS